MLREHCAMALIAFILLSAIPFASASEHQENDIDLTSELGPPYNPVRGIPYPEERVVIELRKNDPNIINLLTSLGAEVEAYRGKLIQIKAPASIISQINNWNNIQYVRKPSTPVLHEVKSEGVQKIRASMLHDLGIYGEGVKIAVIDLGFNVYNPEIANNIEEVKSFRFNLDITGGLIENQLHGTACAEILVDTAPGCRLYLYNFETDVEYLMAVDYAMSRNVSIISASVGFLDVGPLDGRNPIDEAANMARDRGIFFVAAAGNEARAHWTGPFRDDDNDGIHNFTPTDETNDITVDSNSLIRLFLTWDDWPYSSNDYNLYLYDESSNFLLAQSETPQTGSQPPTESITYQALTPGTYRIIIKKTNSTTPLTLKMYSLVYELEYYVEAGSLTSPAGALGSFTVGATTIEDDEIQPYSSRGPTDDGRIKPDITAPDGVTTYTYGQRMFYGTSASAPYAAGAAALLLEEDPTLKPYKLQNILEETAVDLGIVGKDNVYGSGRMDVYAAYLLVKGIPEKATLTVKAHPIEYRYPTEPPAQLNITIIISYTFNGENLEAENHTPFQLLVDRDSTVNLTIKEIPPNNNWHEWENYGHETNPSESIRVEINGNRTVIAYLEQLEAIKELLWITLHAHPSSIQYPQEPNEELNVSFSVAYQFNETIYLEEFNVGPEPFNIQVDTNSNINITIIRTPIEHNWDIWDIYGVGRYSSETLNLIIEENRTVIAYFTPVEAIIGDFIITITPQTHVYMPGQIINHTITVTPVNGFNSTLSLSVQPISKVKAYLNPEIIQPGEKSILTLLTDENTPLGPFTITVKVEGGGKTHDAQVTLQRWAVPWMEVEDVVFGLILGLSAIITIKRLKPSQYSARARKHKTKSISVFQEKIPRQATGNKI